ncbi:hypothetical protein MRB53_041785 [Persea americana]|nr:hypothetical protein MRB53_041785 [Persea americana]
MPDVSCASQPIDRSAKSLMLLQVKRTIKVVTRQKVNSNKPPIQEGFPMRDWSIEIYLVNENDNTLVPATCFEKVTWRLHETFGDRANQSTHVACYERAQVQGGEHQIAHDLNFQSEKYESPHKIVRT